MTSLTPDDADAIRRDIPLVKAVAENVDGNAQMVHGHRNWNARWRGVSPEYFEIKRWVVVEGSFFTDYQVRNVESVVVIGETVRQRLFGAASPVGDLVRIQASIFRVVGLLGSKGQTASGQDQDDVILIPFSTAERRVLGTEFLGIVDSIYVSAASADDVQRATGEITSLLHRRHRIRPGRNDDFTVKNLNEIARASQGASRVMTMLLLAVASISLLVGGIGIMNILLVSVTERTREIGIRMAVGAKNFHILYQFLVEAVTLSMVGGLAGAVLGISGARAVAYFAAWPTLLSAPAVLGSFLFSGVVGVFFGFYPARKAARLDPIAALRYE